MGRKKKIRPKPGDPVTKGMSERDIAATGVLSRRQIQHCKKIASIPDDKFEQLMEQDTVPAVTQLVEIATGRKVAQRRASYCPHCGGKLR